MTFEQYVAHVGTSENLQREGSQGPTRVDQSGFLRERHQKLKLTEAQTAMIKWLAAQPGGPAKILVISEEWSSDCRRDVPALARLADARRVELGGDRRDPEPALRAGHRRLTREIGRARLEHAHSGGIAMPPSPAPLTPLDRRRFVQGVAAVAAGAALSPRILGAQGAPWAQRPPGNPQKLTFVVWQYGKIYEQIAKQFEDDWGIKLNQIIEPNVEPQVAKLTTMFGAGDEVDVSLSPIQYLASYIQQGIAVPIDGLPGVDQYIKDFTPFARAAAQRDGKTWGLPYFSTAWIFIYNDELLGKAGFKGK